jgi:hypothetical protein
MSGLKFLTEPHEAGTGAKGSHWFVGGTNGMVAGTATRLEGVSRYMLCQQEWGVER